MRTQTILFEGRNAYEKFGEWTNDVNLNADEITRIEIRYHKL